MLLVEELSRTKSVHRIGMIKDPMNTANKIAPYQILEMEESIHGRVLAASYFRKSYYLERSGCTP